MPIYEYEAADGERREVLLPSPQLVMSWDGKKFRRVPVARFSLGGFAPIPTMGRDILRGYRDQEDQHGSRLRLKIPAKKIKEAWADETA